MTWFSRPITVLLLWYSFIQLSQSFLVTERQPRRWRVHYSIDRSSSRRLSTDEAPPFFATTAGKNKKNNNNNNNISWMDVLLTNEACEDIAQEISERMELPFFCPQPIVYFATFSLINAMATQLSPQLLQQIGDAVNMEELDASLLNSLTDKVATEMNRLVDIPVLDEEQEQIILAKAASAVLNVLVVSSDAIPVDPKLLVDQSIETVQTLLGEQEGRQKLARILNAKVDFPFLEEPAEQDLLAAALDACAAQLVQLLPPGLINVLQGHGPEGLDQTKQLLVEKVNQKVDIMGISEEQEVWLFDNLVSVVFDLLLEGTEAELLIMSPEEQLEELKERRVILNRELSLCGRRYQQERSVLLAQLQRVESKLDSFADRSL